MAAAGVVALCSLPLAGPLAAGVLAALLTVTDSSSSCWAAQATPAGEPPTVGAPGGASTAGRPTASSTGVTATSLTPMGGGTVSTSAAVIENVVINGDVQFTGSNLTVRNVRVSGEATFRGDDLTIEASEFGALGLSGTAHVRVSDVEITGHLGKDGIHITSDTGPASDVVIEDSLIHQPQVTPTSHYDGIQVRGVTGLTIRRTNINLGPFVPQHNAALFLEDANGGNSGVLVEGSWLQGGGYVLYAFASNVSITSTVFSAGNWGVLYPGTPAGSITSFTGNTTTSGAPLSYGAGAITTGDTPAAAPPAAPASAPSTPPQDDGTGSMYTADVSGLNVAGYTGEQLVNALVILQVGEQRGVPLQGQTIAVMTAMGESSLKNLTYGDDVHGVRNPDGTLTSSIGLFQQQKWYGTVEQRLDPAYASGKFYDDLLRVPGWQTLPPTIAAHRAQRNANPYHYERYWPAAVEVVEALAGYDLEGLDSAGAAPCGPPGGGTVVPVTADGWARPATGQLRSGFGPRDTGIPGASTYHLGADIAAPCSTPIHAAADGVVVAVGPVGGMGNRIKIDHGGGVTTVYGHLLSGTMKVRIGDPVTGGEQVAGMGGDKRIDPVGAGTSSGCHLHFEVHIDGAPINPVPFMAARGVPLGS